MVICVVVGCSKRSDRDKDVSFYQIPTIRTGRGERELELSTKRRAGFLAAVSRENLTENSLEQARICSRHFISGKPASLFEELHPDWLPTQNLGHSKISKKRVLVREQTQLYLLTRTGIIILLKSVLLYNVRNSVVVLTSQNS